MFITHVSLRIQLQGISLVFAIVYNEMITCQQRKRVDENCYIYTTNKPDEQNIINIAVAIDYFTYILTVSNNKVIKNDLLVLSPC